MSYDSSYKEDLSKIEEEVAAEIDAAEKFAKESPEPEPATVLENIFA